MKYETHKFDIVKLYGRYLKHEPQCDAEYSIKSAVGGYVSEACQRRGEYRLVNSFG